MQSYHKYSKQLKRLKLAVPRLEKYFHFYLFYIQVFLWLPVCRNAQIFIMNQSWSSLMCSVQSFNRVLSIDKSVKITPVKYIISVTDCKTKKDATMSKVFITEPLNKVNK